MQGRDSRPGGGRASDRKLGGSAPVCVEISKVRGAADTDTLLVPRRAFVDPVEEHLSCINILHHGWGGSARQGKLPGGREGRQIFGGRLWTFAFRLALEGREGILTAIFLGTGRDYTNPMCMRNPRPCRCRLSPVGKGLIYLKIVLVPVTSIANR